MILPALLKEGDEVLIVSPASPPSNDAWKDGLETLKSWGLKVELGPHALQQAHGLAGTDAQRKADMQWALDHPRAKAILALRGGYGCTRILDQLDFTGLLNYPKWLVGFSDITAFLCHLNQLGIASLHGPMPNHYLQDGGALALQSLRTALFEGSMDIQCGAHPFNQYHMHGEVEAELIGGNLSLLVHLLGSPSFPKTQGKILFLEEVGEAHYQIDRMLVQLKRAGVLQDLAGLILGAFSECPQRGPVLGSSPEEVIAAQLQGFEYPISYHFPAGHVPHNLSLVFGLKSKFMINSSGTRLSCHWAS